MVLVCNRLSDFSCIYIGTLRISDRDVDFNRRIWYLDYCGISCHNRFLILAVQTLQGEQFPTDKYEKSGKSKGGIKIAAASEADREKETGIWEQ